MPQSVGPVELTGSSLPPTISYGSSALQCEHERPIEGPRKGSGGVAHRNHTTARVTLFNTWWQMKSALILVDVQNDFADPSGSLYVAGGDRVARQLAHALQHNQPSVQTDLVIATRDWHSASPGNHFEEWPVHCVSETWGAQLHPAIENAPVVDGFFYKGAEAAAYSGFEGISDKGEPLDTYLRSMSITHVTVVGLATDYCVKATALDAKRFGYETTLNLEYCAGVAPETTEAAIAEMRACGVNILQAGLASSRGSMRE